MSNLGEIAGGNIAPEKKELKITSKEIDALEKESKELAIALQKMELKEKAANLQDLEERLAERELKRENKRQRSLTNGATLRALEDADIAIQKRCNHKKGGNGAQGIVAGRGDSPDYAVIKHTFANGDMWIRCQRCRKTWKPPVKRAFTKDGVFNTQAYDIAMQVYEQAKEFQTKNIPSSAYLFRYSDNGEYYREVTESSNLR